MNNIFDDVRQAVAVARDTQAAVDRQVIAMAKMIVGRLRQAKFPENFEAEVLADLKRELAGFNIQTKRWTKP